MTESPRIAGFLARLGARQVTMGVIGLGYTGLPLAMASVRAGFTTFGYDTGAEICDSLNQGVSHIGDVADETVRAARSDGLFTAVAAGLEEAVADGLEAAVADGLEEAVADGLEGSVEDGLEAAVADGLEAAVAGGLSPVPDVVFLCVPTPFENGPDLSAVRAASRALARVLRPGMVIVAQSTSYPGTTTEVIQPLLEESGLRAGHDFALAFAPERIDPGNARWNINTTPRLVGGVTAESTRLAGAALGAVLGDPGLVRPVASPAVAEFAKLLENSYRLVNIGLVNELAVLAHEMGIDIAEVIDAAATKPYGFQPFYPGVGPGGACIPEDPLYLAWKARTLEFDPRLIDLAVQQNQDMARYVLVRLFDMLSRRGKALAGSRVLCVGAGYKPGVADTRHSRALRVMELLCRAGAEVDYSDDVIPSLEVASTERKSVDLATVDPAAYDLVAVLSAKRGLDLGRFLAAGAPVFDAARALESLVTGDVERLLTKRLVDPRAHASPGGPPGWWPRGR